MMLQSGVRSGAERDEAATTQFNCAESLDTRMEPGSLNTSAAAAVWPPLDMRGVAQPVPSTKDAVVIAFILLLWLYSIVLTARAYSKLLSDGRAAAESDMQIVDWWR